MPLSAAVNVFQTALFSASDLVPGVHTVNITNDSTNYLDVDFVSCPTVESHAELKSSKDILGECRRKCERCHGPTKHRLRYAAFVVVQLRGIRVAASGGKFIY